MIELTEPAAAVLQQPPKFSCNDNVNPHVLTHKHMMLITRIMEGCTSRAHIPPQSQAVVKAALQCCVTNE